MNKKIDHKKELVDAKEMSLEEWLTLIKTNPKDKQFTDYEFPTEDHRLEYLNSIASRSDSEVFFLLRKFLIQGGSLGHDKFALKYAVDRHKKDKYSTSEYDKRLLLWAKSKGKIDPWQGITWIIDLLPHSPRAALDALDAYFLAHCTHMPDGRLMGMSDAMSIVRAKFILHGDVRNSEKVIKSLNWREFEVLVANLYKGIGYDVELTPSSSDGGKDIIAVSNKRGRKNKCIIECKKHSKKIGVGIVRQLYGVIQSEKYNKGILVTSSSFTKPAKKFAEDNAIELIDKKNLIHLLNEHLGSCWCTRIGHHLTFNNK